MEHEIVKEAIKRVRGLPTISRIRKELTDKLTLRVTEEELEKNIEELIEKGEVAERTTTIKGNEFKGYKIVETKKETGEREEDKTEAERIIDDVFK
jgi:hypothetical protein